MLTAIVSNKDVQAYISMQFKTLEIPKLTSIQCGIEIPHTIKQYSEPTWWFIL